MSLDPHWYSTIFGVLTLGGQGLSTLAFTILVLAALVKFEPMSQVADADKFHDLGKLMFAFVMLWAYFSVSQLLIIWSANLPEEIPFYLERLHGPWATDEHRAAAAASSCCRSCCCSRATSSAIRSVVKWVALVDSRDARRRHHLDDWPGLPPRRLDAALAGLRGGARRWARSGCSSSGATWRAGRSCRRATRTSRKRWLMADTKHHHAPARDPVEGDGVSYSGIVWFVVILTGDRRWSARCSSGACSSGSTTASRAPRRRVRRHGRAADASGDRGRPPGDVAAESTPRRRCSSTSRRSCASSARAKTRRSATYGWVESGRGHGPDADRAREGPGARARAARAPGAGAAAAASARAGRRSSSATMRYASSHRARDRTPTCVAGPLARPPMGVRVAGSAQPSRPMSVPAPGRRPRRRFRCCETSASTRSSNRRCRSTRRSSTRPGRDVTLGEYFGARPGGAGARLLRVPDALHAGAQRPSPVRSMPLDVRRRAATSTWSSSASTRARRRRWRAAKREAFLKRYGRPGTDSRRSTS